MIHKVLSSTHSWGGSVSKQLLSIFGIGIFLTILVACGGSDDSASSDTPPPPPAAAPAPPPAASQIEIVGTRVDVKLEDPGKSGKYRYNPADFTFSTGDEVTFVLTSEGEFHTFTVSDLGIDVGVDANATESLTFKFDKAGTYELICIPHQTLGMKSTITVQ